jgi:hypothetical protein
MGTESYVEIPGRGARSIDRRSAAAGVRPRQRFERDIPPGPPAGAGARWTRALAGGTARRHRCRGPARWGRAGRAATARRLALGHAAGIDEREPFAVQFRVRHAPRHVAPLVRGSSAGPARPSAQARSPYLMVSSPWPSASCRAAVAAVPAFVMPAPWVAPGAVGGCGGLPCAAQAPRAWRGLAPAGAALPPASAAPGSASVPRALPARRCPAAAATTSGRPVAAGTGRPALPLRAGGRCRRRCRGSARGSAL